MEGKSIDSWLVASIKELLQCPKLIPISRSNFKMGKVIKIAVSLNY